MSNQLVVRLATLGRPQQLSGLLDVVIPAGIKDGDVLYYSAASNNFILNTLPGIDGGNTVIRLKRDSANTLAYGELYYSFPDRKLYIGNPANNLVAIAGDYYVDLANSIFLVANLGFAQANAAYARANTGVDIAVAGYNQANTARDQANTARDQANTGYTQANIAYNQANTAYNQANTAYVQANTARDQANTGVNIATLAFDYANTRYSANGGTISGDVEITGNLSVLGNVTSFSANNIIIDDPFILLANNNTSDVLDVGIAAHYESNLHTGLFRSASTKEWYLFKNYDEHFFHTDGGNINLTGNNFTLDIINTGVRTSNLILGGANAIVWIRSAFDQANTARNQANTGYNQANAAYGRANVAYDHANAAYSAANVAFVQGNTAYTQANTARDQANTAYNQANTAYVQANTARDQANTAYTQGNTAYNQANTGYNQANAAYSRANVAYDHANAAYARANTKLDLIGGTISGDLVVTGNITVSGQTSYANTIQLLIGDNILTLNADLPAAFPPSENAGLEVNRGSSANVAVLWNEGIDAWTFTNNGTNYFTIPTNTAVETATTIGQNAFGQANTAYGQANTSYNQANTAYLQANTARDVANLAFAKANAALPNVSGSVFAGDLIVSGDMNTSIIRVSDGSNTVPSITFTSASNTGIYRTTNNQIGFTIGGTDALYLSGASSNTTAFEILDANNEAIFTVNDVSSGNILELYDIFTVNTVVFSVDSNQTYVRDRINVNSYLTITSNTRVAPSNVEIELTRFSANTFSGGKFIILGKSGSNTHISEVSVVHNSANAFFTEYGIVFSNMSLFTAAASLNTNNVVVSVVPTQNAVTTFTIVENRLIV